MKGVGILRGITVCGKDLKVDFFKSYEFML